MEKCALTAIFFLVMTGFYTMGWSLAVFPFDNMLLWDGVGWSLVWCLVSGLVCVV